MSKWTFGIVSDGQHYDRIQDIRKSIVAQNIPNYEIIVVCGDYTGYRDDGIFWIPFDETLKEHGWITRKKNLITKQATYENIAYLHDYAVLTPGWYEGFEQFGYDWLTCMNKIIDREGRRFRDWCVIHSDVGVKFDEGDYPFDSPRLLRYNSPSIPRWQFYSGAFFCAKRHVMEEVPLDETLLWGGGEDVKFSREAYKKYGKGVFNMNPHSTVQFIKDKEHAPWEDSPPI